MFRPVAALLAALTATPLIPAACAQAQAAGPFPEVRMPPRPRGSSTWAYVCIGAGLGLLGGSTILSERANDRYDEYLRATDPGRVRDLYDETVTLDRLSTASLLTGEALIATGLYLRFLRREPASRMAFHLGPARCAVSWRF